jgi:hypothetical protein
MRALIPVVREDPAGNRCRRYGRPINRLKRTATETGELEFRVGNTQEFWRTVRPFRRIMGGRDTCFNTMELKRLTSIRNDPAEVV